jgi:hypothetical protein
MTERNDKVEELRDAELDVVCGGAGCIGPWIVDGKIVWHQPAGGNDWLPGGARR